MSSFYFFGVLIFLLFVAIFVSVQEDLSPIRESVGEVDYYFYRQSWGTNGIDFDSGSIIDLIIINQIFTSSLKISMPIVFNFHCIICGYFVFIPIFDKCWDSQHNNPICLKMLGTESGNMRDLSRPHVPDYCQIRDSINPRHYSRLQKADNSQRPYSTPLYFNHHFYLHQFLKKDHTIY